MIARIKLVLFLCVLFALIVFNNRFLVLGREFSIITAGNLESEDRDIYVIYSPDAKSESSRINTVRKAAYRLYRRYFKSPVTIYLSPYKKNYGVFLARIDASCSGGVCFLHDLASTGIFVGKKEKSYISRYHELAVSRRTFNKEQILPRLYKEMGQGEVERIHSKLERELIYEPFFISNKFNEREIETIF